MPHRPSEGMLRMLSQLSRLQPDADCASQLLQYQVQRRLMRADNIVAQLTPFLTVSDITRVIDNIRQSRAEADHESFETQTSTQLVPSSSTRTLRSTAPYVRRLGSWSILTTRLPKQCCT